MRMWLSKCKHYFSHKEFLFSALTAVILLLLSFVVNWYAGTYATEKASNAVTDIVLSNTRVFDVDGIYIYGPIIFWLFIGFLCLRDLHRLPFTFKTIALFVVIRSIFISLTHLGPFPSQVPVDSSIISWFSFGGDLFFSGHTGLAFLMALVFWENIALRMLFVATAALFGVVVLLAHLHYSIDVLSAFFITYTIFHMAVTIFKKDHVLFRSGSMDTKVML